MEILTEPKNALVKQYQRMFELDGVDARVRRPRRSRRSPTSPSSARPAPAAFARSSRTCSARSCSRSRRPTTSRRSSSPARRSRRRGADVRSARDAQERLTRPHGAAGRGCRRLALASALVRPFTIDVPDAVLDDLRDRLAPDAAPAGLAAPTALPGCQRRYLRELVDSWREFDWRARERWLNGHPQFLADIDDTTIHFVHRRAQPRRCAGAARHARLAAHFRPAAGLRRSAARLPRRRRRAFPASRSRRPTPTARSPSGGSPRRCTR